MSEQPYTDLLSVMGTDGSRWAHEYVSMHGGDESLLLGWFANAIEAGRDAGIKQGRRDERTERMADATNGVGHWIRCPHCGYRHDITFAYNCGQRDMLARCKKEVARYGSAADLDSLLGGTE